MRQKWFIPFGWVYIPIHILGYMVTLLAIIFLIPVAAAIFRNGHSVSDDLYELFIYISCVAFWWKWVADKTS
jgi:hypothetical protein